MRYFVLSLAAGLVLSVLALNAKQETQVPCECHTWHNITVKKGTWDVEIVPIFENADFYMGNCTRWVDSNNASVARFTIDADNDDGIAQFGYLPTNDDTFDCAYSLTMVRTSGIEDKEKEKQQDKEQHKTGQIKDVRVERDEEEHHPMERGRAHPRPRLLDEGAKGSQRSLQFQHIACQFTITAAAAATPDVRAQEYNGALCRWDINPGVGENYYIDYVLL